MLTLFSCPKMSRDGWAMARVNAFLTLLRTGRPSNSGYKQDNDLLPKDIKKHKMSLRSRWIGHLTKNNMTYCKHFVFAVGHGLVASKLVYIYVFMDFPCWYRGAGGKLVRRLNRDFTEHKKNVIDK